ncbi:MAG: serine hydrolase [Candidatus Tyrphobacter sp.]
MRRTVFLATVAGAASAVLIPCALPAASLADRIDDIVASGSGTFGIFARTMAPGPALFSLRAYESFPCASTIKVLVMTTAFYTAETKRGVLAERITFHRDALIGGSDHMANVPDGTRLRVGDLIAPMILVSDNTAANMLIEHFGVGLINGVGREAGMLDTHLARPFIDTPYPILHEPNVTTPYDMGTLLYEIEYGAREAVRTIVSPEHCRRMIALMLAQQDRDKIPAGLPPGVPVADKDGEIDGTRDDAGIVEPFGDSPFVLSIYSKDVGDYDACLRTIRRIARATYDAVAGSDL